MTASHNPPERQRLQGVSRRRRSGLADRLPPRMPRSPRTSSARPTPAPWRRCPAPRAYETAGEDVVEAYIAATAAVAPAPAGSSGMRWVYTAMHGVGWETLSRIVRDARLPQPFVVDEQLTPDATFRTVSFPNPEEPGAMDLAFARARRVKADLHPRQRPRRRPPRRRSSRRLRRGRLASSDGQRGRAPARREGRPRRGRHPRSLARLLARVVARTGCRRRAPRTRLPRDPDRIQVDLPRPRHRLRIRGGARVPREPRGPCATRTECPRRSPCSDSPPRRETAGPRSSICSMSWARRTGTFASGQVSVRVEGSRRHRQCHARAALAAADPHRRTQHHLGRRPAAGSTGTALRRRAAVSPRRRLARHRPTERHRTEAQGSTSTPERTPPKPHAVPWPSSRR